MNPEYQMIWQFSIAMLSLVVATILYVIGGRKNKWIRRYGTSLVLAITANVLCAVRGIWSPWFLLVWPMLVFGFSLGYGADDTWTKFWRRLLYAVSIISSGLIFCFVFGGHAWLLFVPHVFVGIWSVWLGIKNPVYAPVEESLVCMLLNIILISYPFIT